jgi:hypothetical protein
VQRSTAWPVAVAVVDRLEAVDVDDEGRRVGALTARQLQVARGLRVERAARQGAGEVVGARELQHPLVHAVGDQQHEADVAEHVHDHQRAQVHGDGRVAQLEHGRTLGQVGGGPEPPQVGQPPAGHAEHDQHAADAGRRADRERVGRPQRQHRHAAHHDHRPHARLGPDERGGDAQHEQRRRADQPCGGHGLAVELAQRGDGGAAADEHRPVADDGRDPQWHVALQHVRAGGRAEEQVGDGP